MRTLQVYKIAYWYRSSTRSNRFKDTILVAEESFNKAMDLVRSDPNFESFIGISETDTFVKVAK